jgi:hypothetical protein
MNSVKVSLGDNTLASLQDDWLVTESKSKACFIELYKLCQNICMLDKVKWHTAIETKELTDELAD